MKLMQWLKNLFGKKKSIRVAKPDHRCLPSDPEFDIHAWVAESREIEEKYPDSAGVRHMNAVSMGFKDHGTPEEMAEQNRRWAEMQCQEAAAKHPQTTSGPLVS